MNTDTTSTSAAGIEPDPDRVQHLAPEDLVMDANVRHQAQPDRALISSIRDHGVLQPIIAAVTDDGRPRVRHGHRRTLAAIAAGRATIPVIVHPADAAAAADAEAARMSTQMVENTLRQGLSAAEQLDVFAGLANLGLSAGQIATRTKARRRDVADGLKAARTPEVRAAVVAGLTLEQGAVLDEFAEDPQAYQALLDRAANPGHHFGGFDHLAQRLRDERAERAAIAAVTAELTGAGVTVVEPSYRIDEPTTRLDELTDDPEPGPGEQNRQNTTAAVDLDALTNRDHDVDVDDEEGDDWPEDDWAEQDRSGEDDRRMAGREREGRPNPITPEAHTGCPGHAAYVSGHLRAGYRPVYVCTDPLRYGHRSRTWRALRTADPAAPRPGESIEQAAAREEKARAEATAARAQVIAGNKAWTAAETVRRQYLAELLTRRTPPKGAGAFVAGALAAGTYAISRAAETGHELAAELLAGEPAAVGQYGRARIAKLLDEASDQRANVVTLGLVLGAIESGTGKHSWRQDHRGGGADASLVRYLRFLAACGYDLAPIERWAIGEDVAADEVFTPPANRAGALTTRDEGEQ